MIHKIGTVDHGLESVRRPPAFARPNQGVTSDRDAFFISKTQRSFALIQPIFHPTSSAIFITVRRQLVYAI
jgi:hypothetical protein